MVKVKNIIFLLLLASLPIASAFDIFSPNSTIIYDKTFVLFNLSSEDKSLFYYSYLQDSGRLVRICTQSAFNCAKNVRLNEGNNILLLRSDNGMGSIEMQYINISIDDTKPRIIKVYPSGNSYGSGFFSINYTELNLKDIALYYGGFNNPIMLIKNNTECSSGINQQCNFSADLSSFNGNKIQFWFSVTDLAGNSVNSSKTRVNVDLDNPKVVYISPPIITNTRVKFYIDIAEPNFDRVTYTNTNNCGVFFESSRVLCTTLKNGRCIFSKTLCLGFHNITLTSSDKADNSVINYTSFDII